MDFERVLKERKSVRNFSKKKPDWRDILECVDAGRHIPTAGKNFVLRFMVVQDKEKIQEMAKSAEQDFIAKAHFVIAVYSDNKRLKNLFGDEKGRDFSKQESGAAIQSILLSAEDHKIGACWVGHFDDQHIKQILKIPEEMELEAIIPMGYDFGKAQARKKIDSDSIIFFDEHKKKKMRGPYSPES